MGVSMSLACNWCVWELRLRPSTDAGQGRWHGIEALLLYHLLRHSIKHSLTKSSSRQRSHLQLTCPAQSANPG